MSLLAFTVSVFSSIGSTDRRGEWLLERIPEFGAGYYSSALYNTGTGLDHEKTSRETPVIDPKFSFMQLISYTTKRDVKNYCDRLAREGYTQTFYNCIEGNEAFEYEKDGRGV